MYHWKSRTFSLTSKAFCLKATEKRVAVGDAERGERAVGFLSEWHSSWLCKTQISEISRRHKIWERRRDQKVKCKLFEISFYLAFPTWARQDGSPKKGGEQKGRSAINEVVAREGPINIHKPREWVSRSVPLGQSEGSGTLPWRRWELWLCTLTLDSTKLPGPKEWGTSHTISGCGCPESVTRTRSHPISSVHWSSMYLSPLSKQLMWMRTTFWLLNRVIKLQKESIPK